MDPKHWNTLELPKILEQLVQHTSFSAGAEKARSLAPSPLYQEIRDRVETTTEARTLLRNRPETTLGGARDVRTRVEATQRGVVLLPPDLLDVRSTLNAARTLRQSMLRLERQYPHLADIAGRLSPCPDLIEGIGQALDDRGQVRDNASDRLARIRRELQISHDRLVDRLQRIISQPKNARYLQETLITQREGRYVIPLKADFKGRIQGIVHDRSSSGATLFIEPLAVVDLNNTWRELQIEEEQEIQRILSELSARVASHAAEIAHTVDALADLDLAFAMAAYAEAIDATAPELVRRKEDGDNARKASIRFLEARHPLLHPETVVPIDVTLDEEMQIVVITGPNTGGKTVSLKTIGLLTLMAQAGLHIPVAPGSALSPFEAVYADIGDEQSIEQSLSTFSSHLTNILSFIDRADENTLVLLDELGAGTDPAEGAALARSLLETFRRRGATTFVATHYPELKAYAQITPGVQNASVEFDTVTLRPTYHLSIGLPGRSNAFAIARRLGLDDSILREAEGMVAREDRQTEDLLADLHNLRLQAAEARNEAYAARKEVEREREALRQERAHIGQERADVLREAREEAAVELEMLREELRALRQRMKAAAVPPKELSEVEEEVEELEEELEETLPTPPAPAPRPSAAAAPPARPIRPGDTVWVAPLRSEGEVLSLEDGEAEVQVGPARTRVPLAQLELRAGPEREPEPEPGATYEAPSPGTRIDMRGATVEEALLQLERHLDAATLANLPWLEIVHGKGTGALRSAVQDYLRTHSLVESYRLGREGEGGTGVTIVTFKQG